MSKHLKRSRVAKALTDGGLAASFDDAEGLRRRLTHCPGRQPRLASLEAAAGPFAAHRHAVTIAAARGPSQGSRCPRRGKPWLAISWCRYRSTRPMMRGAHTGLHLDQARINRGRQAPVIGSISAAALRSIEYFFHAALTASR